MNTKEFNKLDAKTKRNTLLEIFDGIENAPAFFEVLIATVRNNETLSEKFYDKVYGFIDDFIHAKDQKEKDKALEKLSQATTYLQKLHQKENQEHNQDMLEAENLLLNL